MSPDAARAVARLRSILAAHRVDAHQLLAEDGETADQAQARLAVIDAGGDELAEAFLDHERLRHLSEGRRWWNEVQRGAVDESETEAMDRLDEWQQQVLARRGGAIFRREYGWAHCYLHASDLSYQ